MLKFVIFLAFCVAISYGQTNAKPVFCGEIPNNILSCLNYPDILSRSVISKCHNDENTACDLALCAFRKYKWLNNGNVDKTKVIAHFNQYAIDQPEWKSVIDHVIPTCIERDLPEQGIYLNCSPYDIMHCVMTGFIQKAAVTQWSTRPECVKSRQFAEACPVCPSECFAQYLPTGTCNACQGLPTRTTA